MDEQWDVVGKLQEARLALQDAFEGGQDLGLGEGTVVLDEIGEALAMVEQVIPDVDLALRRRPPAGDDASAPPGGDR